MIKRFLINRNMKKLLTILLIGFGQIALAQSQITLEDIYVKGAFSEESLASLNWMNDGQFYSALEQNSIIRYDVTDSSVDSILVDGSKLGINIVDYSFSSDEKVVLLMTDRKAIYRRSFKAEYHVYDFESAQARKLSNNGPQSYATFSPDGSMVAFTRGNNLFYVKLVNMSEFAITENGAFNKIINGSTDWVYEEELYLTKAFEWSPDGKKIAFYTFDESAVKEYNLQLWNDGSLYPEDYRFKYPKAGEQNSTVVINIFNLENNRQVSADIGKNTDIYIPRILWTQNPNVLSILKLNRLQNRLDILHADARNGSTVLILTDKSKTYLDVTFAHELIYLNNGSQFLYSSERDGFKHYYLHRMDGQLINQVTKGAWEAETLVGFDQSKRTPVLYYMSTEDSPLERHFYKVDVKGKGKLKLSMAEGINRVDMSNDFKYYINFNHSSKAPKVVSLMANKTNKLVKTLKDNAKLRSTVEDFNIRPKQFFQFETVDKHMLNGFLLTPNDFDSTRQYPVLLYQYSGPGSQQVKNEWAGRHFYWHQMMVQKGYIVAVIDNRGTGGRGAAFKKMTYKKLGELEVIDHIEGAKFLGGLPFVDASRIGIWGWSYGGYMSSLAMMKGADVFKAGIAVAPVTSWRYYDTIYTERYLQRPQENSSGYDDNSPNSHAEKLKGKYLLIHGTGDDNVHFQNAVTLQNELIKNGKQFESFYYPDKKHGIGGRKTRIHLYNMMTEFILNNL